MVQLDSGPLTVEQWKALPADIKFEGDTMDRLRMGDKKWENERLWQHFVKKVVIPAHQTEVPKVGRDGSILANK
ncbi:hypothetical protein LOC68_14520 [Blastopirellula sp. JC732]|uniref:Uncharacterized protein n=1 Tax=Blastopirellula sediminis TaxID=2894196 RepID=A0A9X1MMY6_9BACT|nr:hypothetical protein [Blastopirellula sediminis]MCC9629604.1 hypothetical protein [Blastopirellula sediminis]